MSPPHLPPDHPAGPGGGPDGQTVPVPWYLKRIVLPVLVLVAIGAIVVAVQTAGRGGGAEQQGIRSLVPIPGAQVLQQDRVGVVVEPAWDASLSINGTAIPDDQLSKDLDLGQVFFRPGPGKVLESLAPDRNCVTAQIWRRALGPDSASTRTWCFRAS
jgi:hypothetical protein